VIFIGGGYQRPTDQARALGKQLRYRLGRVVRGRRFIKHSQSASGGVSRWIASMDEEGGSE
jgi:hypothetical protein